jgi:hypothetical protein
MHALPWGQERLTLEGGGTMKARLFALVSALAALFAVGGAGSRW